MQTSRTSLVLQSFGDYCRGVCIQHGLVLTFDSRRLSKFVKDFSGISILHLCNLLRDMHNRRQGAMEGPLVTRFRRISARKIQQGSSVH
jgi:hypothetical protein